MTLRRWLGLGVAVALLGALGVPSASGAPTTVSAGVSVSPVPSTLPMGAAPRLPYVDVAAKTIVDGTRRVSVAGLAGVITHLQKVDGGYVVGRNSGRFRGGRPGLVFITNSGSRWSISSNWLWPSDDAIYAGVRVSTLGDRIVFNTAQYDNERQYRDTVIIEVPSGRILHRRTFASPPAPDLLGFDGHRVLLGEAVLTAEGQATAIRSLWWTPGRQELQVLNANIGRTMSADLSARQYIAHMYPVGGGEVELWVMPIPPRTGAHWDAGFESQFGVWSGDDLMVAGASGESIEGIAESYAVHRASDGTGLLSVSVKGTTQITWESNSRISIMTYTFGDGFQLIRCNLDGVCRRVGPLAQTMYRPYVIADRRNS